MGAELVRAGGCPQTLPPEPGCRFSLFVRATQLRFVGSLN